MGTSLRSALLISWEDFGANSLISSRDRALFTGFLQEMTWVKKGKIKHICSFVFLFISYGNFYLLGRFFFFFVK